MENFRSWFESHDIFGFDNRFQDNSDSSKQNEDPIRSFDIELMINLLSEWELPSGKESFIKFVNEVHWGTHPGAVRLWIGTGLSVAIEQLNVDLQGEKTWLMKKFFQINRDGYGGYEETVAEELFEHVKKIDEGNLEKPMNNWNDLEDLVLSLASKIKRTAKEIFIFEGIRKVNNDNYIIKLGLTGHGLEGQDQQRVEQNLTDVSYDRKTGKIRIINTNVESGVGSQHEWAIMPSDEDFYFFPSQNRDEIVESISTVLKWF